MKIEIRELVCHKCKTPADFKKGHSGELETPWVDWHFSGGPPNWVSIDIYLCGDCQADYDRQIKALNKDHNNQIDLLHKNFLNLEGVKSIMGFMVYKENNELPNN
jgi:hypothetical protein